MTDHTLQVQGIVGGIEDAPEVAAGLEAATIGRTEGTQGAAAHDVGP